MEEFSRKLQIYMMISIYVVATILTILFEFVFMKIKKFLYRQIIPKVMTVWQLLHFLTRILLGFVAPDYWYIMIGVDIAWEVLERVAWHNENWYDLIYNLLGMLIGICINKLVTKKNKD